tara:strand:- start:5999 stop:6280 length:282 start_codon:yes stop_codon:yes gene_type:complete
MKKKTIIKISVICFSIISLAVIISFIDFEGMVKDRAKEEIEKKIEEVKEDVEAKKQEVEEKVEEKKEEIDEGVNKIKNQIENEIKNKLEDLIK